MATPQPSTATASVTIDNSATLIELVAACIARYQPIVDYGIAHNDLGHSPPPNHIKLTQCGAVIEHYEGDLAIRAAAGTTMGALQVILGQTGQYVPIDTDDDMTLGEVIVHHVYGPLRVGHGSVRDLLLGLRYIDGLGRDIHVGGRTVKNVAGYDVTRLMIGSLGELGCVYEATLRTKAVPEAVHRIELRVDDPAQLDKALTDLLACNAAPAYLSMQMTHDTGWTAHVGYMGHAVGCRAQVRALEVFVGQVGGMAITATHENTLEQDHTHRSAQRSWRRRADALVKIIVPPATTGAACNSLAHWARDRGNLTIDALPVHGCIFAGGALDAPATVELDHQINRLIADYIPRSEGLYVWYTQPFRAGDQLIEPFGPPQPDWPLLTKLKHTIDPHGLFNPGRFLPISKPHP